MKVRLLFCITAILLSLSSCSKQNNVKYENETIVIPQYDSNKSKQTILQESEPSQLTPTPAGTVALMNPFSEEFTGVPLDQSYPNNDQILNCNYKPSLVGSNYLCPDFDRGVTYFINNDKDNYIYELKDNVATLLIDMPAQSLQLWENKLYFIVGEDTSSFIPLGPIYTYDFDTGEITCIEENRTSHLYIHGTGIYYRLYDEEFFTGYHLDHDLSSKEELSALTLLSYHNYQIRKEENGIYFSDLNTNTTIKLLENTDLYYLYGLEKTLFYCIEGTNIHMLDLEDGKAITYDVNTMIDERLTIYPNTIYDMVFIDNIIYFSTGFWIYQFDYLNHSIKPYSRNARLGNPSIITLYTDNMNLYGLTSKDGYISLDRIILHEDLTFFDDNLETRPLIN